MEIGELIFFYLHEDRKTIDVNFRLTSDSEEVFRSDCIDLSEAEIFGYNIISNNLETINESLYYDIDDEEYYDDEWDDIDLIDEESLILFLNEYYILNINKLPKKEFI